MMLMPANDSSGIVHYLAGKYPGKIGWLMGPTHWKQPRHYLPYALDNDAYAAFVRSEAWNAGSWRNMLKKAHSSGIDPLWVLVPDVVADRLATIQNWKRYAPEVSDFGWPLAFAVQDGMTASDVPESAQVVFVGGTTNWKWRNLKTWTENFPRVHVGRVNTLRRVLICQRLGVESIDGSGWFRATSGGKQARDFEFFVSGKAIEHADLFKL